MGIKAGIWLRVSTAGQDEANQRPDLLAYCEALARVLDALVVGETLTIERIA
jgi:DNA invertase Pin-like site-specific DNA recombinase